MIICNFHYFQCLPYHCRDHCDDLAGGGYVENSQARVVKESRALVSELRVKVNESRAVLIVGVAIFVMV